MLSFAGASIWSGCGLDPVSSACLYHLSYLEQSPGAVTVPLFLSESLLSYTLFSGVSHSVNCLSPTLFVSSDRSSSCPDISFLSLFTCAWQAQRDPSSCRICMFRLCCCRWPMSGHKHPIQSAVLHRAQYKVSWTDKFISKNSRKCPVFFWVCIRSLMWLH